MNEFDITKYKPTSLTVSMFDAQSSVFGFTFNTVCKPLHPVIRIKKDGDKEWIEYPFESYEASTVNEDVQDVPYYISKAEVQLDKNSVYSYFVWDKGTDVRTEETTIRTKDCNKKAF